METSKQLSQNIIFSNLYIVYKAGNGASSIEADQACGEMPDGQATKRNRNKNTQTDRLNKDRNGEQ